MKRPLIVAAIVAALLIQPASGASWQRPATAVDQTFAGLVAALSERGGYFNTDNLISNERSYLHVAPELRALAPQAAKTGVYIGVGPDQNFSYIAQLRPSLAIIVDIRRDNLLLHLLFKALFAEADSRTDYLALLTGRERPAPGSKPSDQSIDAREAQPIDAIVKIVDSAKPLGPNGIAGLQSRLMARISGFGVPLADSDRATILAFHRRFIADGLSLRFNTTGRAPQYDYPTYRDLLREVDRHSKRQNFLASADDFQFVKRLHAEDKILPIVGDLGGSVALRSVARYLNDTRRQVTAFYASNVEQYLFRSGSAFASFVDNLGRLPRQPGSVIIRSAFPSGMAAAPILPGYNSASLTQPIQALLDGYAKGRFREYWELIR